jgi:hypothetical protein
VEQASETKDKAIWFTGIDDALYSKIRLWHQMYWSGEVYATRKFMMPKGVVDMPTKMTHYVPFRKIELDHMVRILESLRPKTVMLDDWKTIRNKWGLGKPLNYLPFQKSYWSKVRMPAGIHRVIPVVFYPEHLNEILLVLNEAKNGQVTAAVKAGGKELFEE